MTNLATVDIPEGYRLSTEEYRNLISEMFGFKPAQAKIAKVLDISQSAVSNCLRGSPISTKNSNKLITAFNQFIETGELPSHNDTLVDEDKDGDRPFVAVSMARDRASGRLYTTEKVNSGLIGTISGPIETDEQVVDRINRRFGIMSNLLHRMLVSRVRSMIVQAAPGVGKTYRIEQALRNHASVNHDFYWNILSGGGVTAFSLYKALYKARNGGVVMLDDNDSFLRDEESLNMLKNALDSSDRRMLSWAKRNSEVYDVDHKAAKDARRAYDIENGVEVKKEEEDIRIPDSFEFKGSMIFITNQNMHEIAESGSRLSTTIAAMMDRSWFVNLTIRTARDKILWVEHVFLAHMYQKEGISLEQAKEIIQYVKDHATKFYGISLRLVKHISEIAVDGPGWKEIVEGTKFKE